MKMKRSKYPPGPTPVPFFGNLLTIASNAPGEDAFLKWRNQYGDIYTYWLGPFPLVSVTGYEKMNETFNRDDGAYDGRIDFSKLDKIVKGGSLGIVPTEGATWGEQRRFVMEFIRKLYGGGRGPLQAKILTEVEATIHRLEGSIKKGLAQVPLTKCIDAGVGSVVTSMLFGHRFAEVDDVRDLKDTLTEHLRLLAADPLILIGAPNPSFYKCLPFFHGAFKRLKETSEDLFRFFDSKIAARKQALNLHDSSEPTNLVDAYLREMARRQNDISARDFRPEQLRSICYDCTVPGLDAVGKAVHWTIAFLIRHPDVQAKAQAELDRVVGSSRLIEEADRDSLPYMNAVVHEGLRMANLVAQNLIHRTTKDVVLYGYPLPKGTCVVPHISAELIDPKVFNNPKQFNPENFLDESGAFQARKEWVPFSVGHRSCAGEVLARTETFLFTANLLNHFKFSPGSKPISYKRELLGLHVPIEPYSCKVEKRTPTKVVPSGTHL
ncbi:Protein CYP-33C2 [Aphelenchoides avenae]|nr:Protein CYP-33C2 [Aphelenchus avenae]